MRVFSRKPRRGSVWTGPSAYIDQAEAAHLGIVPGHWAVTSSGRPAFRLVCVDDAPGDADDGACHFEVAGKGDPIARAGRIVPIEFHGEGKAEVSA